MKDNSGHKEKADDTENKNKWKLENVIPRCSEDGQKIKTEAFSVYSPQKTSEIEHQQTAVVENSILVEKTLNNSDPDLWQKNHTSLMNTILQELRQKTKYIKSRLDNTGLKPHKVIPRNLFPSRRDRFKVPPDSRDQGFSMAKQESESLTTQSIQDRFPNTTGHAPEDEPCVMEKQRTTWKQSIQKFFRRIFPRSVCTCLHVEIET